MSLSQTTYAPLDTLKPIADEVWIVDSGPFHVIGIPIPVRMVVIRLKDGELILHSPTQWTRDLADQLRNLGRISHLVCPNSAHWTYVKEWQTRYPHATTWAVPGLSRRWLVKRSGLRIDQELTDVAPRTWADEILQCVVLGGLGFRETAFFHNYTRTLLLTDLIVNLEPQKLPPLRRLGARALGVTAPEGRAALYLRGVLLLNRKQVGDSIRRIIGWEPEGVVMSHGSWIASNGTAALRRSFAWAL
jgi:hypothetical protein